MSAIPADLKYANSHEWVRDNGDGTLTVGITDHAQEALGDIVFVELPEVGRTVGAAEPCAVIESVKAASDIYAPVAGTLVAVNTELTDRPEAINTSPYETGWMFRMAPSDTTPLGMLLDADGYARHVADEG